MFPECVQIPGGTFIIGCSPDDKFGNSHELPHVEVTIHGFALGKHPVSEQEFSAFQRRTGDVDSALPAVNISWHEATAYCEWLRQESGDNYRLPTEAEWEYACRAGSTTPFPSGFLPDPNEANLYYDECGNRIGAGQRLPCGWGRPNAFGLHDMLGNVCEWVQDDWTPDYETLDQQGAAQRSASGMKVIRGGGWDSMPRLARPSNRDFLSPIIRRDNLGFRVAKEL
tara:strand:+ start:17638 stop:18315 length:678 start_codon:yes stop_codon:yes gene_type:complete